MKIFPLFLLAAAVCRCYASAHAAEVNPPADTGKSAGNSAKNIPEADGKLPGTIVIEGDQLNLYFDRTLKSSGNAALHQDKEDIYGDSIEYDMQNQELHVIGNSHIVYAGGEAWGPELHMKISDNTGEMKNPSFRMDRQLSKAPAIGVVQVTDLLNVGTTSPNVALTTATQRLANQNVDSSVETSPAPATSGNGQPNSSRGDAKTILFEGDDKKHLKDARFTSCAPGHDDWYIKAKDMVIDDYTKTATAKNASIAFQGVPILYTPWLSFSFLNQRQSGFLAPTFGTTSRSGVEFMTPYYWNISPDKDATLAARFLSKRGLQYQGEFRYLGEGYSGIDSLEYLPNDSSTDKERFYVNLRHQQNFGNGWSAAYDIERVSDNQYFTDMTTRIITTSVVNLPQQASVSYGGSVWSFNGLVQKYQTLDGISYPYERLPQLTLNANKDWGVTTVDLKSQFVNFERNDSAPIVQTTPAGNTLSTAVTGNRLTAYPSISLPMQRPYGYITPKLGVSYTTYGLDNPGYTLNGTSGEYQSADRTLPIFSIDSGLFFDRDMRVVNNRYTQTFEPRVYYVYIPYRDQSMFPIFDTGDSDVNLGTLFSENQYTGGDRINNANQISIGGTSRMIDAKTGEQRLAISLGERFYFVDQRVGLPGDVFRTGNTSDIVTALTARLINKWNVDAAWQYNTDTSTTIKANIGTRFNPEPGKVLNLSYRYTQEFLDQMNIAAQWPLGKGWYGLGRWNYSLRDRNLVEAIGGVEYDAGCWQLRSVIQQVSTYNSVVNPQTGTTANTNYAFFVQLELGGLTSIGSNPLDLLKRSINGYTNSRLIPDAYQP